MTPLQQLAERGQSVWIDYLSRSLVKDGDLKETVVGLETKDRLTQIISKHL